MSDDGRLGERVPGWVAPRLPDAPVLEGRFARLERLDAGHHADDLFAAYAGHDLLWDYMAYGPFATAREYRTWAESEAHGPDPAFYAIQDRQSHRVAGVASLLRITPAHGVIEVGHICLSPALQGTVAATEAMFLMAEWVFAAGYRRYEWKCNALNLASRRAAQRLGFSFEGIFRQHMVIKGRNRDTAWFAMTDRDWPALRVAYLTWLNTDNFDAHGCQKQSLSSLTAPHLVRHDPGL